MDLTNYTRHFFHIKYFIYYIFILEINEKKKKRQHTSTNLEVQFVQIKLCEGV